MKVLILILLLIGIVESINNGLGRTPQMGYNTWNDFRCNISENDIIEAAQAIVRQKLNLVGYEYVNMDDCWAQGLYPNGTIYPDPVTFPNGIAYIADYVHSLGLKFGLYTDRGNNTCAGRPGSWGHEQIDADTYASWGVDYLKEDSCNAPQYHPWAFDEYAKMRDALNSTNRPIFFSLCGWNVWYSPIGNQLGNSWRIAGDCNPWSSVLNAIDVNAPLYENAGPGGWNDPDMLLGSDPHTASYLTQAQSRTMFSMWSVMAAPLLIGSNIRNLSTYDLTTYSNTEVIAIDQDILGYQGRRVAGGNLTGPNNVSTNVWGKRLANGDLALIFLNNHDHTTIIGCSLTCFNKLGFLNGVTFSVRDLWAHTNNGTTTSNGYNVSVEGGGASVLVRLHVINTGDEQ